MEKVSPRGNEVRANRIENVEVLIDYLARFFHGGLPINRLNRQTGRRKAVSMLGSISPGTEYGARILSAMNLILPKDKPFRSKFAPKTDRSICQTVGTSFSLAANSFAASAITAGR